MFNFANTIRQYGFGRLLDDGSDRSTAPATLPGFNVPPLGYDSDGNPIHEAPTIGFNFKPPGFDVPALGYDPDGNAIQETPAIGPNVKPQGVVPVNCTASDGSMNCMTPRGESFNQPAPQGFPQRIAPDDRNHHYYHHQSEPMAIPAEKLLELMVANPTPNLLNARAATVQGTLNEATPDLPYALYSAYKNLPPGAPFNQVRSYFANGKDGNAMVINVTEPGHNLAPGYVVLYVTSSGGLSTIHAEGEGLSPHQASYQPERQRRLLSEETWRRYFDEIAKRAK